MYFFNNGDGICLYDVILLIDECVIVIETSIRFNTINYEADESDSSFDVAIHSSIMYCREQ